MLILSDAQITVHRDGSIVVEGDFIPYRRRLEDFLRGLGASGFKVRARRQSRGGYRYLFSRHLDATTRQRLLNFLVNECRR